MDSRIALPARTPWTVALLGLCLAYLPGSFADGGEAGSAISDSRADPTDLPAGEQPWSPSSVIAPAAVY